MSQFILFFKNILRVSIYFIFENHSTCLSLFYFLTTLYVSQFILFLKTTLHVSIYFFLEKHSTFQFDICLLLCCCMYSRHLLMMDGKTVRNM